MGEQEQGRSEGGGSERGQRGAKPCRVCRKFHWEVFEDTPGSGVWYARVWHKGLAGCAACQKRSGGHACKEKVGPHSLALKRAATWKVEVAEGRFFPKRVPPWNPPFAEHVDDYLSRNESRLVDLDGARRFARYMKAAPEFVGKTMRQLARGDAERYRERRRREGAPGAKRQRGAGAPSTVNRELSFARRAFYDFMDQLEERRLDAVPNPFASRRRHSRKLYAPEPATRARHLGSAGEDEADRLFRELPDAWAKAKVAAAALSGIDRGPMFAWTWAEDIDFKANQVRSWRRKGDGTLRVYWVPMVDDLRSLLSMLPSRDAMWVWPNAEGTGQDDAREFVRLVFKPALRRARIADFRWKDLRHTFASWLRRKGEGLDVIGELLGHGKGSPMTDRYAHLTPDMKHAAVRGLSGLIPALSEDGSTIRRTDRRPPTRTPTVH